MQATNKPVIDELAIRLDAWVDEVEIGHGLIASRHLRHCTVASNEAYAWRPSSKHPSVVLSAAEMSEY